MLDVVKHFAQRQEVLLDWLQDLVEIESPSHDKAAVDKMGLKVAELIDLAGGSVERAERADVGDVVLGHWRGRSSERRILMLCHMDTVWPVGTLGERPIRVEDGRFFGPGSFDMKAGIVIALVALQGLSDLDQSPVGSVTMLCNGDEEIGSGGSRELIESLATDSDLVLCMEPAIPGGAIKTARKGGGHYRLVAKGRAAHAGADHQKGLNAIEEMAHQILTLQQLTDYDLGTTVNVGTIQGGSRPNVVPEECSISVDIRITSLDEAERMDKLIRDLQPHLPGAALEIVGGFGRPPMVRDALMVRTFEQVRRIAGRHGLMVTEGLSGGGSDGSFAAALGVPTVDGMGADGDGGHAVHEHVLIESLSEKAALTAAMLSEWEFDTL
jgi:glutamate carboxypeptidase